MSEQRSYKQLRVFVSSTFNDMRAERSLLVGKIFPMVADHCHRRKMEFIGVDLRWGVSEEQSRRGETVSICMAEIDRCRPLFIGMVGQRYGWVPDGSPVSVTEQEMLYGALEAPEDTEAFFYLRDDELTEALCGPFEPDVRLDDLKKRIRASRYSVMDGYRDLESFGRRVYEDLTALVDRIAAREEDADPVAEERCSQLFLAKRCAAHYVERPEAMARLEECARQDGLTLLTGEPGAGKTALMARWALDRLEKDGGYTFLYFVGSTTDRGWECLGQQLVGELRRHFSLDYPLPGSKEELRRAICILLHMAVKKGRVLLALDQIDALSLDDGFGLSWLPEELPAGVGIVLTADEGEALTRLRRREHRELRLAPLSPAEVGHVAEQYLAAHAKTLSSRQLDMLREAVSARNPLYLITLLDEIRHVGRHDSLTTQLGNYLACKGIRALFDKVLYRIDRDFDEAGDALPRRMLSLLEASRGGLTEGELVPLLGDVPQARFAPLCLAIEPYTAVSGGAIHIAVPAFREAVRAHYGLDEGSDAACRGELIAWFLSRPDTPRRAYVLPWLVRESGDREAMFDLLSEPDCFSELWRRNRYETKSYWVFTGRGAQEGYREILAAPERYDGGLLMDLAELLAELGCVQEANALLTRIVSETSPADDRRKGIAYGLLGNLSQRAGRFAEAEMYYQQKYACARRTGDRYEQQRALGNIGILSLILDDPQAAREAFESVLSLAVALNQRDSQQIALGNLGNLAFSQKDFGKARELYERQRSICLDSGNIAGLINACGALGVLFCGEKDYEAAEREFRMQEEQSRRIGAVDGIANALGNLAKLAAERGDPERAEELLQEKLALCRRTGQFLGEQNALENLSKLAAARDDWPAALDYARQRAELTREHRAFRQYAEALYWLSEAEFALSPDLAGDARLHRLQAESIAKQNGYSALLKQIRKE